MHKSAEDKICLGQLGRTFPENWVSCLNNYIQKEKYYLRYVLLICLSQYYYYFSCLEDCLSSAKIHLKFGSGLTTEEQEIRYQVSCYLSTYL